MWSVVHYKHTDAMQVEVAVEKEVAMGRKQKTKHLTQLCKLASLLLRT